MKLKQSSLSKQYFTSSSPSPVKLKHRSKRVPTRKKVANSDAFTSSDDSDIAAIPFCPTSTDSNDEELTESPKQPLSNHASPSKRSRQVRTPDENGDREVSPAISPPEVNAMVLPRKRSAQRIVPDSEEEETPSKRKRLSKGMRPTSPEPDMLDDLDDDVIIEPRLRERSKKSLYQERLEALKKKKSGSSNHKMSDEDERETEDGSNNSDSNVEPFRGARPHQVNSTTFSSDSDHSSHESASDFIVEDGGTAAELPTEFSMNRHRDFSENFKILCQLLVHVNLQPHAKREVYMMQRLEDSYFSIARNAISDKMSGLLSQTIRSQIWRKTFLDPLSKYPELTITSLEFGTPHCDACNLTARMSTMKAVVSGCPYKRVGFQPEISYTDSGDSSSEDDNDSTCELREQKSFDLGRFCAKRAQVFHSFSHWEYHLFISLGKEIDRIRETGHDFVKVSRLGGVTPPTDLGDGDAIMEWLDDRKVIEIEFQKIKQMISQAHSLDISWKKSDDI